MLRRLCVTFWPSTLLLFIFCWMWPAAGHAGAFLPGHSGLVKIPTAGIIPQNKAVLSCSWTHSGSMTALSYGVGKNVEAGVAAVNRGPDGEFSFDGGFKVRVINENRDSPGVAVGLTSKSCYITLSKDLGLQAIRGHLGVGTGELNGLFAGASKLLNPVTISTSDEIVSAPATTAMVEYVKGETNVALRFRWGDEITLDVGLLDLKEIYLAGSLMLEF